MDKLKKVFEKEMEVRDYECDMTAVVNNSVYLKYLEHSRHCLLRDAGIDFAELAKNKISLAVSRAEIDYKLPLRSGDKFIVRTSIKRASRIRFLFEQEIFRVPGDQLMISAKIIGVSLNADGKPKLPAELENLLLPLISPD